VSERHYISAQGYHRLGAEMDHLLTVERPRVVNNVAAAAAEGDRSENAEYIYGKKRLREIDRRIEFITRRLDVLEVVPQTKDTQRVRFLAWVEVEDPEGETRVFRIVGADETDAKTGWISWRSPVGRALLAKALDDEVTVRTPGGEVVYTIVEIHTKDPA
jgi:transcription elongation factor GreB